MNTTLSNLFERLDDLMESDNPAVCKQAGSLYLGLMRRLGKVKLRPRKVGFIKTPIHPNVKNGIVNNVSLSFDDDTERAFWFERPEITTETLALTERRESELVAA